MNGLYFRFLLFLIVQGIFCDTSFAQHPIRPVAPLKELVKKAVPGNVRLTGSGKPPLTSHNYYPDGTGLPGWELFSISDYKYDSLDRVVSITTRNALSNQVLRKDTSVYDAYGYKIIWESYGLNLATNSWGLQAGNRNIRTYTPSGKVTSETFEWFDTVWHKQYKSIFIYDAADRLSESSGQSWRNNNWETSGKKGNYTYNPDSTIASIHHHQLINNQWVLTGRETFKYYPGTKNISEVLGEGRNIFSGVWYISNRDRYLNWQNGNVTHFQTQLWNNNAWENQFNILTTYDSLGSYSTLSQLWQNNSWQNSERSERLYNAQLNYKGGKDEEWLNNSWQIKEAYYLAHTYDSQNNILETVTSEWYSNESAMKNTYRQVFNYYPPAITPNLAFRIFPNPTSGLIHIELPNQPAARVQISNLTGRIVKTATLSKSNSLFDLSDLPSGLYLLNIQTESGSQTSKIVKQ